MTQINKGVALSELNLTANSETSNNRSNQQPTPMRQVGAVSTNPRGPQNEPRQSILQSARQFLSRKVHLSYLIILSVFVGGCVLLTAVGLAAGLGVKQSCLQNSEVKSGSALAITGKRTVKYEPGKPWTNFRLPRNVIPFHYVVDLTPHFYADTEKWFSVRTTIDANVVNATRYVIVHANAINITSVAIKYAQSNEYPDEAGKEIDIKGTFTFQPFSYFVIELSSRLKANRNITIYLEATGSLANTFEGFYKAPFKLPGSDEKIYAAVTQFEPLAARKAFPCFDEPNMKAYFTIIIRHKPSVVALSNMPLESKQGSHDSDNLTVTSVFRRTNVPMSTYLVAWVVGPYTKSSCRATSTNLPVCVYVPDHLSGQIQYAVDTAVKGMEWFQNFFGSRYPLPKLDMVVLPEFRSAAMENWGLITYREEALLVSRDSTDNEIDLVTGVIMHELAHLWFGNLVTMDWWDDLWLNEGFASFMDPLSNIAIGHLFKGKDYAKFLQAVTQDGMESTRQIRVVDIQTGADIDAAFDAVTYRKGASILRMLLSAIGMENFQAGIRHYLRKFEYGNAKTSDFWQAMSKFSEVDIATTMSGWVEQRGYPVVTVEPSDDNKQLVLRQERFILPQWRPNVTTSVQLAKPPAPPSYWHIPIIYKEVPKTNATVSWFPANGLPFTLTTSQGLRQMFKLNWKQSAYIRVNYPVATWDQFAQQLSENINSMGAVDRAGLVEDSLELAKAGRLPYATAFNLLRFLSKETHPIVWEAFADHVVFLRFMLADSTHNGIFEDFMLSLMRSARRHTRNLPDANGSTKMRTLAILADMSMRFRRKEEINCYVEYYRNQAWQRPPINNLRRAVLLSYLLSNDTEQTAKELLVLARQSSVKQMKNSVQYALANTQNSWLFIRELEKVFTGEMRPPDFLTFTSYALGSPQRRRFIWDWIRENHHRVIPLFGGPTRNIMRFMAEIASFFNTKAQYEEFEAFVRNVGDFGSGERPKNLVMERMRTNIYWRSKLRAEAESALAKYADAIALAVSMTPITC